MTGDTTLTFDWDDAADGHQPTPRGSATVTYIFEIGTGSQPSSGDFIAPTRRLVVTGDTQVTLTGEKALVSGDYVTYVWHVKALDRAGNGGDFSELRPLFIDTVAPGTTDLQTPENGAKTDDATPTLTWIAVSDPSGVTYTLEIAIATGGQPAIGGFNNVVLLEPANNGELQLQRSPTPSCSIGPRRSTSDDVQVKLQGSR